MKKIFIRLALVLVLLLVVGLFLAAMFLGSIVKKGVETVGPQVTKVEMKLDSANISMLSGSGALKGMVIGNPEGFKTPSAMRLGEVSVALKPLSVLSDKIVIQSVHVIAPEITFEGGLKGNNLSKIMENIQAFTGASAGGKKDDKASAGAAKKLQVDDFLITGGKINLSTTLLGGKSATVPLPEIHLTGLGTGTDGITAGDLAEKVFKIVLESATKAAAEALGKGANDVIKGAGGSVEKATKGLGDLFKKK